MANESSEIHGHEVIAMMLESNERYTRESLVAAIRTRFGAAARFHTCCASGLSPEQLVTFLEQRGKFAAQNDGFTIDSSRVCQH